MTLLLESTPTERAAVVAYWLANGRAVTTASVAESLQVSQRTAQRLVVSVSRVLPIYRDDSGCWRLLANDDAIRGDVVSISVY